MRRSRRRRASAGTAGRRRRNGSRWRCCALRSTARSGTDAPRRELDCVDLDAEPPSPTGIPMPAPEPGAPDLARPAGSTTGSNPCSQTEGSVFRQEQIGRAIDRGPLNGDPAVLRTLTRIGMNADLSDDPPVAGACATACSEFAIGRHTISPSINSTPASGARSRSSIGLSLSRSIGQLEAGEHGSRW